MTTLPRSATPFDRPVTTGAVVERHEILAPTSRLTRATRRRIVAVIDPVWATDNDDPSDHTRAPLETIRRAAELLTARLRSGEMISATPNGRLLLQLRREDRAARPVRLQEMAYFALEVLDRLHRADGVVDLGVGWAPITRKQDPEAAARAAADAAAESLRQRDLQPRQDGVHAPSRNPRISGWTAGRQVLWATVGSVALPFLAMVGLYQVGIDVSTPLYWALVVSLGITALTIWAEVSHSFTPPVMPPAPDGPPPRATAVIAAYLPNESDTILETLEHFVAHEYDGGLQVVLAYNSPVDLPVESELLALERAHEQLTVLKVHDSTSKAQNVNAALRVATGEFIGIFDADHHPADGSFERAWRWIADGHDVVQGHCVIRNGADSALARLVAVEFEQIYAVAHPGRASLHGFGIFGGSNGYWRANALERIRLRGSYLTEDIEASMRTLGAGGSIVNDPGLVSFELAPDTVGALWKQRMRWAQGWFQVSVRHLWPLLRNPHMTARQRIGLTYLMGWREVYPWISLAAWPLLGFLAWRDGGLDMGTPLFVLITLFVMVSGPLQTLAAYRLAAPSVRRHKRWFVTAALLNLLVYTEAKNLVNRVAHLKQLRGEHQWVVTPRTAPSTGSSTPDSDHLEVAA
ncbi:Glycosyltransferase, catalytic subunit of cellulose synthase and poly-beta-1,6-N-acetylglucosamine synthase [Nocardioides alpinus]|uniref:Glycosyltransferase, catalytic subunit of cellulose synthase and poly-beta-1,6-N-acetylglucosamine synthase n=1 Tax=Nocardioides alpinus TaxID=748909 RepID=A0A1I0XCU1_9ACTN|nr:glycosyltransferase family 2 protein [Nocardioides alpinus]SFA98869.1 Glycosyltransferase, catalytic subunit of cellulose synthase and poly-beta-1,6-N-acetylglucosamine synthase [Nocardioides alpinus]